MGAKSFHSLHDFVRFGVNIQLDCANPHCDHAGVVDAVDCCSWFRLHRWVDSLDAGALRHFRCTRCAAAAGRARATMAQPTVTDFFPPDPAAWKRLQRRLRG